jgi:hypothetical protein
MQQVPQSANETKRKRNKPAFRNRRRANRLPVMELRAVQSDFESYRNTQETADANLLPRAEAVDAILIGHGAHLRFLADQIANIRKQMGLAASSARGAFLLERGDAPNVRQFVQQARKTA